MELLELHVETPGLTAQEAELRAAALVPPAEIAGLRARWWRSQAGSLLGRYLFDDHGARESFVEHGRDPMGDALRRRGPERCTRVTLPGGNDSLDRPVFVVSAPRAGSTLLADLMTRAEGVWSIDGGMQAIVEGVPTLHLARRGWASQVLDERDADPGTAATLRAATLAALRSPVGTPYCRLTPAARPEGVRVVEACPENALRIPFLVRVFPGARFVYLQRDLRQNVSSMVEAWGHAGFVSIHGLPGFHRRRWCFLLPEGWRRYADVSLTELAGFQWGEANRAIIHALDALPRSRWTTVTYDDLVAHPAPELERLCAFVGVAVGDRLADVLKRPLPLSATTVTPPSPVKWRSNRAFDAHAVRGLQPLAGAMRALRVEHPRPVLRTTQRTTTRFACFVDELEPEIGDGGGANAGLGGDGVVVAPSLEVQLGEAPPLRLASRAQHRERFLGGHPILWVEDPAFGVLTPLWLRPHDAAWCRQLRPGQPPSASVPAALRGQLVRAGVLVAGGASERRRYGELHIGRAPDVMARQRWYRVPALLTEVPTGALGRYYRALIAAGEWPLGDDQVALRHGWHDERVARFVHLQLTPAVSALVGMRVKPTYCFASAYRGGAQLGAHTDREQCELTLSLLVDEVLPEGAGAWPLWFQGPDGRRRVDLSVGDAVLFRGCELPHWRDLASVDHEQVNLLFHFVPASWRGVLQ